MGVLPADYVWQEFINKRRTWLAEKAAMRQNDGIAFRERGNIPADVQLDEGLLLNDVGLWGEGATMLFLSPCQWNYYLKGSLRSIPDLIVPDPRAPGFLAGTRLFNVDAKTNKQPYEINYLQIQKDDDPTWYYVHCVRHLPNKVCMIGWCTGEEGKREGEFRALNPRYDPAYCIPHTHPILKPMRELRILCHGRGAK